VKSYNKQLIRQWLQEYKAGDLSARDRIIVHLQQSVEVIAASIYRRAPVYVDYDELIAAGYRGLWNAIDRYDPDNGTSLHSFATYRIRGAILDWMRNEDKVGRTDRQRINKREKAEHVFHTMNGRNPTDDELFECLKVKPAEYRRIKRAHTID